MVFSDEQQLLTYAKRLEGLRFSEISALIGQLDEKHRKHTKGVAAKVIETEYFGIPTNSSEKPDFEDLGIELKVSPLRYLEKVDLYTTKERNVIKMVDYNEIAEIEHWTDMKVSQKLQRVLYVLYVHDNNVNAWDWKVVKTFLWSPDSSQSAKIQSDYEIMREKVFAGENLREGDHTFFATCPKHGGGYLKNTPKQSPRSSLAIHPVMEFAEKRGYCIKREAFIELIADSIGSPLEKIGRTIGIKADNLEL
jgi:DNA mismatch repair protein MutH